jgi:hypothetical protein
MVTPFPRGHVKRWLVFAWYLKKLLVIITCGKNALNLSIATSTTTSVLEVLKDVECHSVFHEEINKLSSKVTEIGKLKVHRRHIQDYLNLCLPRRGSRAHQRSFQAVPLDIKQHIKS